jgi:hypothetical protein
VLHVEVEPPPREFGLQVGVGNPGDERRDDRPRQAGRCRDDAGDDDRDTLPHGHRGVLHEPEHGVQRERQRDRERPGPGERENRDDRQDRPVAPPLHRDECGEREQQAERLGVGELQDERHRPEGEEHARPQRGGPSDMWTDQDHECDGRRAAERRREQHRDHRGVGAGRAGRPHDRREHGQERPGVLLDGAGVVDGQRARVALPRDLEEVLAVPGGRAFEEPLPAERVAEPDRVAEREPHRERDGRHHPREGVEREGDEAIGQGAGRRAVSHAGLRGVVAYMLF